MSNVIAKTVRLASAMKVALRDDPDMPVRHLLLLLMMQQRGEGMSQVELADAMNVTAGAISKIATKLAKMKSPTIHGLDLIYLQEDPFDRRLKKMYLTEKGKRFLADIEKEL